jgi:hypothetical protein
MCCSDQLNPPSFSTFLGRRRRVPSARTPDVSLRRSERRNVPNPEVERRSFLHFAPHQDGLEFTKAELKNSVYAWYFTEVSVRKKEYWIAQFRQWTQNANKFLICGRVHCR